MRSSSSNDMVRRGIENLSATPVSRAASMSQRL